MARRPGGLVGGFAGGGVNVAVGNAGNQGLLPELVQVRETGLSILTKLMPQWNGTPEQVQELAQLKYVNSNTEIINPRERDVLLEVVSMLSKYRYEDILAFLRSAPDADYIMWNQPAMEEGRARVAREIAIQQSEPQGIKGVGKCRVCPSTELQIATKQTRSCDEEATVSYACVACGAKWRK
jgi:DNA-directed RNA polymerase subunit M/transcription elongation factor TFIIS